MHPILSHVRRLAVYLVAWLAVGALVAVGLEGSGERLAVTLAAVVPLTVGFGVISLSTWYLCRAFPISIGVPAWRPLSVHALASVLSSSTWLALGGPWARLVDTWATMPGAAAVHAERGPVVFLVGVLLYWLTAAVYYLFIAVEASREAERRVLERELLAREAELKALRAQIDPHFMFNSLHSISALTATDPAAARRMCLLLADFLRETLRLGASRRISLADEFALADRFLAIERIRFGSRLAVDRRAGADVDTCLVPPLILQPLLENAVTHGVAELVDGGTIAITADRSPTLLTIAIENPCDADRQRSRGVGLGLNLLRQRLTTQYGLADPVLATEADGRFRVEVRLPVEVRHDPT